MNAEGKLLLSQRGRGFRRTGQLFCADITRARLIHTEIRIVFNPVRSYRNHGSNQCEKTEFPLVLIPKRSDVMDRYYKFPIASVNVLIDITFFDGQRPEVTRAQKVPLLDLIKI